jgi:hypothetical protein
VDTVLGLLGVAVFVPCVIALAAGLTWVVVRYSPSPNKDDAAKLPPASS